MNKTVTSIQYHDVADVWSLSGVVHCVGPFTLILSWGEFATLGRQMSCPIKVTCILYWASFDGGEWRVP